MSIEHLVLESSLLLKQAQDLLDAVLKEIGNKEETSSTRPSTGALREAIIGNVIRNNTISQKQRLRLFGKGYKVKDRLNLAGMGLTKKMIEDKIERLSAILGFPDIDGLTKEPYDKLCKIVDSWTAEDFK